MDIAFPKAIEDFRMKIREFFEIEYPQDIRKKVASGASLTTAEIRRSETAMGAKGWLATAWPAEYGGPGWSLEQRYVFDEERARAGVLAPTPMGVIYIGPIVYTYGTDEQKTRWLPGTRDGSMGWAQGYSEPGSGSDLASLQFSAVREGDEYILNGTKIWTSQAHDADWIFVLARTSQEEKKQLGITFICCEMDRPGVTVIPIITIDDKHGINQVNFDNVRVPVKYRIGEEGKAWTYSQFLLEFERTSYAGIGIKRKQLTHLLEIAKAEPISGNARLIDDDAFATRLKEVNIAVDALEMTVLRVLSVANDGGRPGKEASIIKVIATETAQKITELYVEAAAFHGQRQFPDSVSPKWTGPAGYAAPGVSNYFGTRAHSIFGGTNEIQRNIMAKGLGL